MKASIPIRHDGALDELNCRWEYTVVGKTRRRDGTTFDNSVGFVGTLAWALRKAQECMARGWLDVEVVGLPCAGFRR